MIVAGAKGHAKEVYDIIEDKDNVFFFDNVSSDLPNLLFEKKIITNFKDLEEFLLVNPDYILGLGGCKNRFSIYTKFNSLGGNPISIVSRNAFISESSKLGKGINIMSFSLISSDTIVGDGCLINSHSCIHHDSILGDFVEVSPGAKVLGNSTIGAFTSIGANATILPKLTVGTNVIIAAGAVVTKNIPDNCMVAGVPAIIKKELEPISF
jgi:sugar O-acyltransferase (sialic acid O-acetyltransferase NeuD family)